MSKAKQSETTPKKAKYVNRVVYLGKYSYEEFTILIQVVGNVFQYILHDNEDKQMYQQYIEDNEHPFDFDYLKDKPKLVDASKHLFDLAIGHCNTLRNYKDYMKKAEEQAKQEIKTKKKAKHIKLNIEELPAIKPIEPEA